MAENKIKTDATKKGSFAEKATKAEEEPKTAPDGGLALATPLDKMVVPLLIFLGLVGIVVLFFFFK